MLLDRGRAERPPGPRRATREGLPELDHIFVIVLENHNSILDNPAAPHIQTLARRYNVASNYDGIGTRACPTISR